MDEIAPIAASDESDAAQFRQIYRDHLGFVWRSLRSMGVADNAVEDATHEVFVVLHRRWGDWDRRSKITTWLFGISRGIARNHLRARQRAARKLRAVEEHPAQDSGRYQSPSRRVDRTEAAALLASFLETLDPAKRRAFELCDVEGMSTAEAARCLRENPNTISTRLRRARRAFTQFVDELNARSA